MLYDAANREVAILCNHQRTVPKSFEATFAKLEERVRRTLGNDVAPGACVVRAEALAHVPAPCLLVPSCVSVYRKCTWSSS